MPEAHAVYGRIYSPGEHPFKGTVLVEDGRITSVLKGRSFPRGHEKHQARAVFPGFCNAHVHAHMYSFKGVGIGKKYPEYFRQLFELEKQVSRKQLYENTLQMAGQMLSSGVTRACNMSLDAKPVAEGYARSGLRARLAIAVKNRRTFQENKRLLRLLRGNSMLVPDFGIANERETSKAMIAQVVSAARREGTGIQVHVAEAPATENKFKGTSVAYLDGLSVFSRSTLAVHCTYTTARDIRIIRDRGSWIAVCPIANENVGSRTPPVHLMQKIGGEGVRLGVGTDEPLINTSVDLRQEACFLSKRMGLNRVFELLCAPGLFPLTGRIKPGYHADLVLSEAGSLRQILLGERKVSAVLVGGRLVI